MSKLCASVALVALGLSGCASKNFVRENVAVVDQRVTRLEGVVQQHGVRIAELGRTARDALQRATAAGKLAEGKFLYQKVLSDDSVKFAPGRWDLTPEGETRLVELANQLKSENRNVYLEIQGHTDAEGSTAYNTKLGEQRAQAARRFLAKRGVALNRIAAISYGEDAPVAPNTDPRGRAENRRIVVIVLA